ncbi:hypothetical protein BJ170DRAFT_684772 [Xylariales sp. AK1849]|nr:hypothetical protein BJ170DRAFT_684772 [Xylariales sp. AK1849]
MPLTLAQEAAVRRHFEASGVHIPPVKFMVITPGDDSAFYLLMCGNERSPYDEMHDCGLEWTQNEQQPDQNLQQALPDRLNYFRKWTSIIRTVPSRLSVKTWRRGSEPDPKPGPEPDPFPFFVIAANRKNPGPLSEQVTPAGGEPFSGNIGATFAQLADWEDEMRMPSFDDGVFVHHEDLLSELVGQTISRKLSLEIQARHA